MLTLYCWYLKAVSGGSVLAYGYVSGHPKQYNGRFIHTSLVEEAEIVDGTLLLTTYSGNLYTLLPENIDLKHREETENCLNRFQIEAGFAEHCIQARLAADARSLAEAERTLAPGQLLLEVVGSSLIRAFFRSEDQTVLPLEPALHVGMFQDSVLVTDWAGGTVDFRYFPMPNQLEPYHISDGLTEIVVHNLGTADVAFGRTRTSQPCRAGEMTVIRAADHDAEGLFSPDAVNGKGLYQAFFQSKEEDNDVE